jgi:hypothetical protein
MKPFNLSLHSLLEPDIIECPAHDPEALPLLIVPDTPQLMLRPLILYSQLVHETAPLIKKERKRRWLVPAPTILLNQVLFIGVESGLDFKQKLFVDNFQAFELHFPLDDRDRLHFSCKVLHIHIFEVLFKACIIKV